MTFWRRIPPVSRRSLFKSNATSANPTRLTLEPGAPSEELQQPYHITPRLLSSFLLERQSRNASADVKEKSTLHAENALSVNSGHEEVSADDPIVKPKPSKKKRKPIRRSTNELAAPVKLPDVPTDKKKVKKSPRPATEKRKKRLHASISKEEDPHEKPPHQKRTNYCLPLPYMQRMEGFLVPTTRPSLQGHRYFCTLNYSDLRNTDLHPEHPQRDIAKLSHGLDRVLFKYATLCPVADIY